MNVTQLVRQPRRAGLLDPAHVARILRTFYLSPVSLSALQPVLELAVQLNPDLRGLPVDVELVDERGR